MEEALGSTLYRASESFYLIPDDVDLDLGPLEIRSLDGGMAQVDPLSVARFRVTESVARAFAKRAASNVADRLESSVAAASSALASMTSDVDGLPDQSLADLSAQLQQLVGTFQSADLTTDAGRASVEEQLSNLQQVKRELDEGTDG